MFGIVVALLKEAEGVIDSAASKEEKTENGKKLFFGKIGQKDFVLILSGIGKVNAAMSTQYLIDNYHPEFIVNFGSVGATGEMTALSYFAVDKCCQYDFDLSALDGVPVGYIQDYDAVFFDAETDRLSFLPCAHLASSDRFTEKEADLITVKKLGCQLFDMEGGAIAQVCTANSVPLYIFKGITDVHGSNADPDTFYINLVKVCSGFYTILSKAFGE